MVKLVITLIVVAAFVAIFLVPVWRRPTRFKQTFGFEPSGRDDLKSLEQRGVHEVMRGLASARQSAEKAQEELQRRSKAGEPLPPQYAARFGTVKEELREWEKALKAAEERVEMAEERFYRALSLAEDEGYRTSTYYEYLRD